MKTRILAICALVIGMIAATNAQDYSKMYLIKGNKIVGSFPTTSIDYITFEKPADATASEYAVTVAEGSDYTANCPEKATAGKEVIFSITVTNPLIRIESAKANGTECTFIADDNTTWYYRFTMPDEDVEINVATVIDRHTITPIKGEHSILTMLNCSDDWDKKPEDRIFNEAMGGKVKFLWGAELGYDATLKITSKSGKDISYEYTDKDEDMGKCWFCVMPDEPITLETKATEKTDYVGKPFVREYKGYRMVTGENNVFQSEEPTLSVKLNANTSFLTKSTDENALDFDGCYYFDEAKNTFSYLPEYSLDEYGNADFGINGTWFEGGDALMYMSNLKNHRPDDVEFYFASMDDFKYTFATSDSYSTHSLIELDKSGKKSWYYFYKPQWKIQKVTVRFLKGSSIGDESSALVTDSNGDVLFRYSRNSSSESPVFIQKSKEAGTYSLEGGTESDKLILDGFGGATYGYLSGTYTIEGSIVKFTSHGETTTFIIDSSTMTYTVANSGKWDGAKNFMAMVTGTYGENTNASGMFTIKLDSDYSGNEKEGSAKVSATLTNEYYQTKNIVDCSASYTYDSTTMTITVTGVLVGTADGKSTERISIVFNVADDKKSMTCNEDKLLRSTSGGDTRYINLKDLKLLAR